MRVLLSTIGSRGEVQPTMALALALRGLGQEMRMCAPPDFRELIESFGVPFVPVGVEVRKAAAEVADGKDRAEALRRTIPDTVALQFEAIGAAAVDCDILIGCGALQIAAHSIAQQRGIPYLYNAFAAITLPSEHHAPLLMPGQPPAPAGADNLGLWERDAQMWNGIWAEPLNAHRVALGLEPVTDVRGYIFTESPLLASDPTLDPWIADGTLEVTQTGAWIVPDGRPLPEDVEAFLAEGAAPIYFGFGSMRSPEGTGRAMVDVARALGYRAIVQRGWADLTIVDEAADCLIVGEVNQRALFARVAAIVHHGGAGTTNTATLSGAPQVVVPHMYDQFYFARRVAELGIGVAHPAAAVTGSSLTAALEDALRAEVVDRARSFAAEVRTDGANTAARQVVRLSSREAAAG